ncbi:uncharacterized protein OCT59_002311 [Rhizophagus irregularis]|uniref:F-box domain-containing protein n=1 Tax=Rhizophagus irregularis (strain DAOM 197198w) TaxID=1432141 RepID=A0A015KSK5_RHIIW|nr:hypothetical protein RirG_157860 [Rhizophagus irregularis DAOM 197198w]UZO10733.1 hypothetical protein OCT59_002311 [Rhizophagus irregularis]GBC47030.1 hypothetical protein GLOIN_2v1784405 [Rhizophagus irregularis DAOM 181602=DAOM 197198]
MACQLPTECLNEILEYLEGDKLTLHSCLLVNRLWCKIAVRILWRNILDYNCYQPRSLRIKSSILSTLIANLPIESKNLLHKNEIFISTPTLNSLLFNYVEFCKVLSINKIISIVEDVLSNDRNNLVTNEIIKMFINEISSLEKFTYYYDYYSHINISIPYVPGARDLSELCCSSNLPSSFLFQLSQTCHNLQSISISFEGKNVSNGLNELISSQNKLKNLTLSTYRYRISWAIIIPAVIKHSKTITKLQLYGDYGDLPLSFVSLFTNLQKCIFSFDNGVILEDFKKLQNANFLKLEILKIPHQCFKPEYIIKFLENNGKNLKIFYMLEMNKALSLTIAKFCPNIRKLFIVFNNDEIDILKAIFINCKYLESIKIWFGNRNLYLKKKEVLDTVVNYSQSNFHKLKIHSDLNSDVTPKDWESFFIGWKNRTPKKLLFLIFINIFENDENLKIIEKYQNLGIIKFWCKDIDDSDYVLYN